MKLHNIDFSTWCSNHDENHDSKWFRELYPYKVFQHINFSPDKLFIEQIISFNRVNYFVTIHKIELQVNGRYRTTFDLSTYPATKAGFWKNRIWNVSFQIVYTAQNDFITVFTKKEDPSKDYVTRFMQGNFAKISLNRSLPISELLFKTLLLHISEENFPNGSHYKEFGFIRGGVRNISDHPQFKSNGDSYYPFYSIDRELWVSYAFNEDKAHRIAFYNSNQCHDHIVVYCNPTFTPHHRCSYSHTKIISIYQFANLLKKTIKVRYDPQIRYLQNHLNVTPEWDIEELIKEIKEPTKPDYEILKSDLMEAFGIIKIKPLDVFDTFQFLASVNLINAWLGKNKNEKGSTKDLIRKMYHFKTYLSDVLIDLIKQDVDYAKIHIRHDLSIIEVLGFQFSFHCLKKDSTILIYEQSEKNHEIIWEGKRLQPVASLILHYSRALKAKETYKGNID